MWFLFKILHVRGRNTFLCKGEMCFTLLGGVITSFFLYTGLVIMFTYIVLIIDIYIYIYIYIYMLIYVFFTYLYMCCFFSLFIHMFLYLYAIFYFCLILRCLDVLFKVFQKYRLSKSTCHKFSSCKVFQEFVLG